MGTSSTVVVGGVRTTYFAIPSCLYASPTNGNPNDNTGRRRRRNVPDEPEIVPDRPSDWIADSSVEKAEEDDQDHSRDGRLMLYWVTTTSTTTSTLATINCTPNGWTMLSCLVG